MTIAIDLPKLRVRIGLASNDSSRDAEIANIWPMSVALAETYCDRKFETATETEKFTHVSQGSLSLLRYPVTAILSGLENHAYHLHNQNGLVLFDGHAHEHEITVTYTGGYTAWPLDLEMALLNVVGIWLLQSCTLITIVGKLVAMDFGIQVGEKHDR